MTTPDRPKGTYRLYDKDFNLLAKWQEGDKLHVTLDNGGQRWSGVLDKFTVVPG